MSNNILAPHIKGTTWYGMVCTITEEDGSPKNLTGVTAISTLRKNHNSAIALEFNMTDSSLTIPNPIDGRIYYNKRFIDIPEANYKFDLFITNSEGDVDKAGCGIFPIVLCND